MLIFLSLSTKVNQKRFLFIVLSTFSQRSGLNENLQNFVSFEEQCCERSPPTIVLGHPR